MKRIPPLIVAAWLFVTVVSPLPAATTTELPTADRSPAAAVAGAVAAVTGIAISPLLGTSAYGAYLYFAAPEEAKESLPWFAKVGFWLPAMLLVGAVAAKDAAGAVLPPGWKKPLDVLETVESKVTGLVAAGAVVPFTMTALSRIITSGDMFATTPAALPTGLATIQLGVIDWSWLLNILTVPFGVAIFAVVWMASHAINGLILLSPWGAIDAALKAARTSLLALMAASAQINPWISAGLSLVVIVIAYFIAGWSFRLTTFSAIFSWDFLTGRSGRYRVKPDGNKLFAGIGLAGVPQRTYGRLHRQADGTLLFRYRPWLVLPEKEMKVRTDEIAVGRGAFFSTLVRKGAEVCVLPPRYRGHEEDLAEAYALSGGVQPIGLNKAWSWLTGATRGEAAVNLPA